MIFAICLFLVGACAGAYLAIRHFLRRRLPGWVAIGHGAAGATGFAVLLSVCVRNPGWSPARYGLLILVFAIALGCVNVVYHLRRLRHRSAIIVAHALAAVTGVGTLTYGVLVRAAPGPQATTASQAQPVVEAASPPATPTPETAPAPAAAPPPAIAAAAHPAGFRWSQRTIAFADNSASPNADSMPDIEALAGEINRDHDIERIEVQGHADERGSDELNLALTRARASAVVDALVAHGVDRGRLQMRALGARCPAQAACRQPDAPKACHDEASWQRDRRVDLLVVESRGERFRGPTDCATSAPESDLPRGAVSAAASR